LPPAGGYAGEQAASQGVGDPVVDAAQAHAQRVDGDAEPGGDRLDRPPT
jgi:hypothetical protein